MKKYSKILIPSFYIGIIGVMIASAIFVIAGVKSFTMKKSNMIYTLDGVFDSDVLPVTNIQSNSIVKPYTDNNVKVGKYFYDFESDKNKQEESIIQYEGTYMQNNGVDYVNSNNFDVVAILNGEIISVEDDEVYGKVVTIKHNENLKSVYSNVTGVLPTKGYKVSQGEIIASSSKPKISSKFNSLLHFEVYYKGNPIDPENLYTMSVSELQ